MGCATVTVKISTIVFNILLAIIGIGGLVWVAYNQDALTDEMVIASYITSSCIIIFSILGCVAAIRESVCLAAICAIFLLILAILQAVGTYLDLSDRETRNGLTIVEKAWDADDMNAIQATHECCGKDSAQDYILLEKPIPPSCYPEQNISYLNAFFRDGCSTKLQDYYNSGVTRLLIVSGILIAFEILGFLLALFLVINFRNKQRRMQF